MEKLKEWFAWLRKHRKDWPIFVALIVICLNIELVVTPHILKGIFDLSGQDLAMSAGIWSSVELGWWIFFSIWLFKEKIRKLTSVDKAINLGKEVIEDVNWDKIFEPASRDSFPIRRGKEFIRNHIRDFDLAKRQEDTGFMIIFGFARGLGYILACLLIFAFALLPLFWTIGLMICRLVGWRMAYAALFSGNFIKNYFLAGVYERIGFWWLLFGFILMAVVIGFIVKRGTDILRTRANRKQDHS